MPKAAPTSIFLTESQESGGARWLALSAKERVDLVLAFIGLHGDFGDNSRDHEEKKQKPGPIEPSPVEARLIEWKKSGRALPDGAEELIERGRLIARSEGASDDALRKFAQEGSAQSKLLRRSAQLLLAGKEGILEYRDAWLEKCAEQEERAKKEGAKRFKQALAGWEERRQQAQRHPGHRHWDNSEMMQEYLNPNNHARHERSMVNSELAWRRQELKKELQGLQETATGVFVVMARALQDGQTEQASAGWPLAINAQQAERAAASLLLKSRQIPGGEGERPRQAYRSNDKPALLSPIERALATLYKNENEPPVLDEELGAWLARQARAQRRFSSVACAELLRLAMNAPDLMEAFMPHVKERLLSLLPDTDAPWSMETEFPAWRPRQTQAALGRLDEISIADEALRRAKVAEEAQGQGPMGRLAAAASQIYGFTAASAEALVGEAKKALISEAGWTQGVWRMAANCPEFAEVCAKSLAEQAKEARAALTGHEAKVQRQKKKAAVAGAAAVDEARDEEAARLIERRKREAAESALWLVEKQSQAGASTRARALMSVGQAALVRGGMDEASVDFSRLVAEKPKDYASQKLLWARSLLAGSSSKIDEPSEAAVLQALADQKASQALSAQWAAALAEGWARETRASAAGQGGAAEGAGAARADKKSQRAWAIEVFSRKLGELQDCVANTPGFMQALPKKFNWGFLMNAQARWHEAQQDREFSASREAEMAWATGLAPFAEGEFSAEPLASAGALFDEGRAMKHCVFSYADRCYSGGTRIVSIRRGGERVSTLELFPQAAGGGAMRVHPNGDNAGEVARWTQGQNNGSRNSGVSDPAVLAFCERYKAFLAERIQEAKKAARQAPGEAEAAPAAKRAPRPRGR
jgi:hypothetical protein